MATLHPSLLLAAVPAVLASACFEAFLGHRHDYTGHFMAGYGGTLGAFMVWFRGLSPAKFERYSTAGVVPLGMACILLGVFTEATAFRLAKFDEIDFCNQSLGAVLAATVATAYTGSSKLADRVFDHGLILALAFLSVGACFAVA